MRWFRDAMQAAGGKSEIRRTQARLTALNDTTALQQSRLKRALLPTRNGADPGSNGDSARLTERKTILGKPSRMQGSDPPGVWASSNAAWLYYCSVS